MRWRQQYPYEDPYWDLATYNAEVHRGIVHTPEYDARMAAKQEQFLKEAAQNHDAEQANYGGES